jgi:hypothetical protein
MGHVLRSRQQAVIGSLSNETMPALVKVYDTREHVSPVGSLEKAERSIYVANHSRVRSSKIDT